MLTIASLLGKLPEEILSGYMKITEIPKNDWNNILPTPLSEPALVELITSVAGDMHRIAIKKTEEGEMYDCLKEGKELLDRLVDASQSLGIKIKDQQQKIAFRLLLGDSMLPVI